MAEQQRGLSSAQTGAILDYITKRRVGRRQLAAEGMEGVGTALTQGQLPSEDESFGREKIQLGLTQVLSDLDKYEQLKNTEKSRYAREMKRHEGNLVRSGVMLLTDEAASRRQLLGSTAVAEINQADTLIKVALQKQETLGWSRAGNLFVDSTEEKVGNLNGFFNWDFDGKYHMSEDPNTQSEFMQRVFMDLREISDPRERASYIQGVEDEYSVPLWAPLEHFVSVQGATDEMGALVRDSAEAKRAAEDLDNEQWLVMERHLDTITRKYGANLDPGVRTLVEGLFAEARAPARVTGAGTLQPPPPEDASYEDKNQWVQDFSRGEALLDPATNTIRLARPRSGQDAGAAISWADFVRNAPVQQERPYAEQTRDYIEELWGDLEAGDRPDLRKLRREFIGTAMFKAYKESRGYPDNPATDPIALRAMIREGRATRQVMKQAGRAIDRQNVLGGQTLSTPGQYRRAALMAALAGPPKSVAAPGRTPLQKIGMALAAPVALPAALLAGGAKEVSKMLKKKGSESGEAEPEAPVQDPVAQKLADIREMFDEGTLNQEQFDTITQALQTVGDVDRPSDPLSAEKRDEQGDLTLIDDKPGDILDEDSKSITFVGDGGYVWEIEKDAAGQPTGKTTILQAPPPPGGKESPEGKTWASLEETGFADDLQMELDKARTKGAEETAVEEGRRMEEQKPDLIPGEMELAEETREERGQRFGEMGVERQPLGKPPTTGYVASTERRKATVETYTNLALFHRLIDAGQADLIQDHFLFNHPDLPLEELQAGMIAGAQKKFKDDPGKLDNVIRVFLDAPQLIEEKLKAIPSPEPIAEDPVTEADIAEREEERDLWKGEAEAKRAAVLGELGGVGRRVQRREKRLAETEAKRKELLDIEKPEEMSPFEWEGLKSEAKLLKRTAQAQHAGLERAEKRAGKKIKKRRKRGKWEEEEATQGGA